MYSIKSTYNQREHTHHPPPSSPLPQYICMHTYIRFPSKHTHTATHPVVCYCVPVHAGFMVLAVLFFQKERGSKAEFQALSESSNLNPDVTSVDSFPWSSLCIVGFNWSHPFNPCLIARSSACVCHYFFFFFIHILLTLHGSVLWMLVLSLWPCSKCNLVPDT